jgi:lipoate-protein ligase A
LDLDVEVMFSILKVPQEKISDKMIADVKERVISIRDLLGREVSMDELRKALVVGFSEALNLDLVPGSLTQEETDLAESLVHEKYGTDEWNLSR